MKQLSLLFAAGVMISAPASAQLSGKWTGEVPALLNAQGVLERPQRVVIELNADGSGKVTTGMNPTTDITSGSVLGPRVAFVMTLAPNFAASRWAGMVEGDKLMLVKYPDGKETVTFSLMRSK